jgi:hypothetical protein
MMRSIAAGILALALALAGVAAASADQGATVQQQIDYALVAVPGGIQTSENTVEWDGGTEVLTVLISNSVGSCATGSFCAFGAVNLGGSKLTFTSCTVHSTAALSGGVHSIANATALGTVYSETSGGTVLSVVPAGGRENSSPGGIAKLDCL